MTLSIYGDTIVILIKLKGVSQLDTITLLIRNEIKKQFGSVKKFSDKSGIPYSTLSNALSKGIGGTAYDTVVKICKLLNIKQVFDENVGLFNNQFYEINLMLSALDEKGLHTVQTILSVEFNRCKEKNSSVVKAYNGIGFTSNLPEGSNKNGDK